MKKTSMLQLAALVAAASLVGACGGKQAAPTPNNTSVNIAMVSAPPGCTVTYTATFYNSSVAPWEMLDTKVYTSTDSATNYNVIDEVAFPGGITVSTHVDAELDCPGVQLIPGSCTAADALIPNSTFDPVNGNIITDKGSITGECVFQLPVNAGAAIVDLVSKFKKTVLQCAKNAVSQGNIYSLGLFAANEDNVYLATDAAGLGRTATFANWGDTVTGNPNVYQSNIGYLDLTDYKFRAISASQQMITDATANYGKPFIEGGSIGVADVDAGGVYVDQGGTPCRQIRSWNVAVVSREKDDPVAPTTLVAGDTNIASLSITSIPGGGSMANLYTINKGGDVTTSALNEFEYFSTAQIVTKDDANLVASGWTAGDFTVTTVEVRGLEGFQNIDDVNRQQAYINVLGYVTYAGAEGSQYQGASVKCNITPNVDGSPQCQLNQPR